MLSMRGLPRNSRDSSEPGKGEVEEALVDALFREEEGCMWG